MNAAAVNLVCGLGNDCKDDSQTQGFYSQGFKELICWAMKVTASSKIEKLLPSSNYGGRNQICGSSFRNSPWHYISFLQEFLDSCAQNINPELGRGNRLLNSQMPNPCFWSSVQQSRIICQVWNKSKCKQEWAQALECLLTWELQQRIGPRINLWNLDVSGRLEKRSCFFYKYFWHSGISHETVSLVQL